MTFHLSYLSKNVLRSVNFSRYVRHLFRIIFLCYVSCAEIFIQKAPGYGVSAGLNLICGKQ